jgi:cbb3-type cytochrome oxidase subunit 1
MTGLASRFFASALIYAVLGMTLGLVMGMTEDHAQMPTHAHILVVGWVSFALFGFFYHLFPAAAASRLAAVHFWLAEASLLIMLTGLVQIFMGRADAGQPFAAAGSIGLLASTILFAIVAWPTVRRT